MGTQYDAVGGAPRFQVQTEGGHSQLVEVDDRGYVLRILGCDGGEPEDQTLLRDWKWVVVELNALANRLAQAEARNCAMLHAITGGS